MSEKEGGSRNTVEEAYENSHAQRVGQEMAAQIADSPAALGLPDTARSHVDMARSLKQMSRDATDQLYAPVGMSAERIRYLLDPATDKLCAKAGTMLDQDIRQMNRDINATHDRTGITTLGRQAETLNETAKLYDDTCKAPSQSAPPFPTMPKIGP